MNSVGYYGYRLLPLLAAIDEQAQHDNDVKDRTKSRRDLFDGDIV